MSTREKSIKASLGMLALADQLQNISPARKRAGVMFCQDTCIVGAIKGVGEIYMQPERPGVHRPSVNCTKTPSDNWWLLKPAQLFPQNTHLSAVNPLLRPLVRDPS